MTSPPFRSPYNIIAVSSSSSNANVELSLPEHEAPRRARDDPGGRRDASSGQRGVTRSTMPDDERGESARTPRRREEKRKWPARRGCSSDGGASVRRPNSGTRRNQPGNLHRCHSALSSCPLAAHDGRCRVDVPRKKAGIGKIEAETVPRENEKLRSATPINKHLNGIDVTYSFCFPFSSENRIRSQEREARSEGVPYTSRRGSLGSEIVCSVKVVIIQCASNVVTCH
ncbi:hypothetical protein ALC53_05524 [Atta colombica]|uniref:Uncharacterized protein n=1 Tax=Atta colombica TaxID=520822 RepID=A0A195BIF1_9HYME|nr:hypothetical protein ALC53_05524 [Atta colombica]